MVVNPSIDKFPYRTNLVESATQTRYPAACGGEVHFKSYFSQYNIVIHDICQVDFDKILKDDIVILGGGGMLYCDWIFQSNIIRLLNVCKNVIAWGIGFNTHMGQQITEDIDFNYFKFIGIRDYNHRSGLTYVPCPSVFRFYAEVKDVPSVRKIGIIEHHKFAISGFRYDKINNSYNRLVQQPGWLSHKSCGFSG
jgi:hypothetical protein